MPRQPNRLPQYTPNRNPVCRISDYDHIVDDRSLVQTLLQVHPTANPSEAEQVLDRMMQDQPMRWRDINQQDFP